jgi:transcriptional regulator with XRE-family HTH domain
MTDQAPSSRSRKRPLTDAERADTARLVQIWNRRAKTLGLTQESVANDWGMTQGGVNAYLKGRNRLSVEAALRFAATLQVDVAEISPAAARLARSALRMPPIAEILAALPDGEGQTSLALLGLQVERHHRLFTAETFAHYTQMIERFQRDLQTRRDTDARTKRAPPFDDQPGSSLDWRD